MTTPYLWHYDSPASPGRKVTAKQVPPLVLADWLMSHSVVRGLHRFVLLGTLNRKLHILYAPRASAARTLAKTYGLKGEPKAPVSLVYEAESLCSGTRHYLRTLVAPAFLFAWIARKKGPKKHDAMGPQVC